MKLKSLIAETRYQLGDLRGVGYPDDLLIEFINDGLCLIYNLVPEKFARSRILQANVGDVQCLDECCDKLLSVDAIVDACGNYLDVIRQGSVKMGQAFDKAPINKGARTWKARANVENEFYVHPPVRHDEVLYFRVTCTSPPDAVRGMEDDIPGCLHHEALLNYVFSRAYAIETESQSSASLSQMYFQRMQQLLGLQRATDQSMREDNEQP